MKKLFTLLAVPLFAVMANASPVTVTYAVQEGDSFTAGETVDVKYDDKTVATLTYGFEGGADFTSVKSDNRLTDEGFSAYLEGNGQNGKLDSGTVYIINPDYDGTITVGVVLNSGKEFFIYENDAMLPDYDGITVEEKYYGTYTFDVVGGAEYKVFCTGSKLGFYGFIYEFEAQDEGNGEGNGEGEGEGEGEGDGEDEGEYVSVTYAVQEGDSFTAGETVDVKYDDKTVATLTYGFAGGADFTSVKSDNRLTDEGFSAYLEGNGQNGKLDSGTVYIINPDYDGTITVGVVLNSGKEFFIYENDAMLPDYDGITVEEKYYGTYTFDVVGGAEYKVFCTGSKLGFYGFIYKFEPQDEGEGGEGDEGEGEGGESEPMEVYASPEDGETLSYEDMQEFCEGFTGGPYLIWGNGAPLFYNKESFDYVPGEDGEEGSINVSVFVDGDYVTDINGVIYSQVEGEETVYSELDILLGDLWEYLYEDYGYNFELGLKVYEGSLFVGKDGGALNEDVMITYNITGEGEGEVIPGALPEPKFDLVDGDTLFICWDQEIKIANGTTVTAQMYTPNSGTTIPVTLVGPTSWDPEAVEGETLEFNDNALMLNLAPYVAEYGAGKYSIVVNAGVVTSVDGTLSNEMFNCSVTLEEALAPVDYDTINVTSEAIVLTYTYNVAINPENEINIIVYNVVDGEDMFSPSAEDIVIKDKMVTISLASFEMTEGATYHYEIPEGFFLVGAENINAAVDGEIKYESSGINAIDAANGNSAIYTLQGVKVSNSVENLSNGLYIINGKKVLIRK